MRFWTRRTLRALGRLVPGDERDGWIREWEAELEHDAPGPGPRVRAPAKLITAAEDAVRLRARRLTGLLPRAGLRDVRLAARGLVRTPVFSAAVILTLALGVGANAAMFSVVRAVLLKPLPYPEADRLVRLKSAREGESMVSRVSTADFDDIVERTRTVNHLSFRIGGNATYQADRPIQLDGPFVSSGFFRLFGTSPHLGRYLLPDEDVPGHEPTVVLSHGAWLRVFGGDPGLVGATLILDGQPYVVAGVAERGLRDPVGEVDMWRSRPAWIDLARRDQSWLSVFGRVASDVTWADVLAELARISGDLALEHPATNQGRVYSAESLQAYLAAPVRPALRVLLATVVLVLVIACANVANLLLVRSAGREREMAVRISLGAGRARLAAQLVVEGLLLAVAGGAAGLALAAGALRAFVALGAPGLPHLAELGLDGSVLLFTLVVSCGTGVVFGLVPLVQISDADPSRSLREGGRGGEGRRVRKLRRALVAGELGLSAVLLVGAGLLVRSLGELTRVDTGVTTEGVLTLSVAPPQAAFPTPAALRVFYSSVWGAISRLPGVEAVGGVSVLPLNGRTQYGFSREDGPPREPEERTGAEVRVVEPGYFQSLGIRLVAGRMLDEHDEGNAPPALLVDEAMARRFFPGEDPIGKRITVHWGADAEEPSYEVVGVVSNVRHDGPAAPPEPTLYTLRGHDEVPDWLNRAMWITVRTSGEPLALARPATQAVWDLDRTVPVTQVGAYGRFLDEHHAGTRYRALLIGAFALLATLLASVGIAGVVAYAVAQRGHELGVRQALGADSADVVRLVLGEGVRLALWGVPLGLILAAAGARVLRTLLFGVGPGDPLTYAGVGLGLALVALVAAWIPARRASTVAPGVALRAER